MKLTGSGLTRAEACNASVLLPQTMRTTHDATVGIVVHAFLSRVPTLGRERALALSPEEHRRACELINPNGLPLNPNAYAAEVAFAYDVATGKGRELGRHRNRDYSGATDAEICGSVDVVGLTEDGVIVPDYKTGWADLGPLRDNLTMRFYGLVAARTYGKVRARLQIIRVREEEHFTESWDMGEMDLDATESAIQELDERLRNTTLEETTPHEGPWCTYCPAFNSCPAKMNLLAVVAREAVAPSPTGELMPGILNDETAPPTYERLVLIDQLMERLWASVKDFARINPIRRPHGYVYGEKQHPEDKFDADAALPILIERFGEVAAASAVEVKHVLKKSAVQDLVRAHVNGKRDADGRKLTQKEVYTSVWQELVEKHAARTVFSPRIIEHKPKSQPTLNAGEPPNGSEGQEPTEAGAEPNEAAGTTHGP